MVYEYVVVEFIEEKAVEIVPQLWIQSTTKGMYAYWPDCHSSMITHKVKKREIPDKENWKRYEVKIFSYTDTYEKALSRRKRAEYTSNVETDEDEENKREAGRPDRYNSSEDEDNSEPSQKKICLPTTQTNSTTTPQASSSGSTTPQASSSHSATPQASSSRSTPQASSSRSTTPQASSSRSTTPQASSSRSTTPQSSSSRSTTPQTNYPPTPPPYQPFYSRTNERREPRILPDLPDCELDTPRSSRGGEINESFEKKVLIALARLQRQGEENSAILKQLRAGQSNAVNVDAADLDSLLTEVMKSKDDIDSISAQLQDANKKNQMTHALSILGGNTVGDTVRKMMRRLGNNALWSLYSLKGKKEKEAFQTTALYRVVVKASLRVHLKSTETDVNDAIIDFLKHAPHQPGGNKYKKSQPQQTPVQQGL
ncbi:Hypothetical predicted protein [Mytilus galloprovincialis]|uniref:DUF4806 domain-containing protein n=1 Tax=Mytilus galloprovincialis TaxID=29158 RepID=A0A8B6CAP4_MYTGA|nr:Hypothetical predicted protein [Mytilus galloprovincialis]